MVQAIGSEVAAETNRSVVMNAPAKAVAVWRAEATVVNICIPLDRVSGPTIGPALITMQGACQLKNA